MHAIAVLGNLTKLKRVLGLAFGAYFLHDFSVKISLFKSLSINKVSKSHFISFSRYQTKCVINLRFFLDQPPKKWLTGEKRGKDGNTKIWISREPKELFRWNEKHFS